MCVFVSRPMKTVTFLRKNGDLPKRVVDFPREETHIPNQNRGNRRDFACESKFLHFSCSFMFFHVLSFSFKGH